MCGFNVIRNRDKVYPNKIAHRGYERGEIDFQGCKLIHYRLALQTQPKDQWMQPIKIEGGYLLFNGEIFNHPEIYANDVEYLVEYFSNDWLNNLSEINRWDGFWSIVVLQNDEIYAFTDPLGKKQLYHDTYGNISSEIKPLLNQTIHEPDFNWEKPEIVSLTPFEGIFRFIPNILYNFTKGFPKQVQPLVDLRTDLVPLLTLKDRIMTSVRSRDINLLNKNTLFVSGGLDSTIILDCLVNWGLVKNYNLLTIENEEEKYIQILEKFYNIKVQRIKYKPWENNIKEILYRYEYPFDFGSIQAQYNLVRSTRGSVIFTGDGADELFSGYNRAQIKDTQEFDVFTELPYYHNIRLDRIGMAFTKEIRSPFMSHDVVRYALNCPYELRKGKQILKDEFSNIPEEILLREKRPLRNPKMDSDRAKYLKSIRDTFKQIKYA